MNFFVFPSCLRAFVALSFVRAENQNGLGSWLLEYIRLGGGFGRGITTTIQGLLVLVEGAGINRLRNQLRAAEFAVGHFLEHARLQRDVRREEDQQFGLGLVILRALERLADER